MYYYALSVSNYKTRYEVTGIWREGNALKGGPVML